MIATKTAQRQFLETHLLQRFAARFAPDALVLNIGAGRHTYREYFLCPIRTSDRAADVGCDETYPAEAIPYPDDSVDGILCNGMFDRLDDPMRAMREFARVLTPNGLMLFGAAGLDFPWHADRDRWRLTPGGLKHIAAAFQVLEEDVFDRVYYFLLLRPK